MYGTDTEVEFHGGSRCHHDNENWKVEVVVASVAAMAMAMDAGEEAGDRNGSYRYIGHSDNDDKGSVRKM